MVKRLLVCAVAAAICASVVSAKDEASASTTTLTVKSAAAPGVAPAKATSTPQTPASPASPSVASTAAPAAATVAAAPAPTAGKKADTTKGELQLTLAELAKYNGKNGAPAYVAVDGVIYDVSDVPAWKGGAHHGNGAGQDLTNVIKKKSPHGVSVLKKRKVVGKLVAEAPAPAKASTDTAKAATKVSAQPSSK